jgi:hypothetical protein
MNDEEIDDLESKVSLYDAITNQYLPGSFFFFWTLCICIA